MSPQTEHFNESTNTKTLMSPQTVHINESTNRTH